MNARRAARELALIVLTQIKINDKESKYDIDEILVNSVRTLANDAQEELKLAVSVLMDMKEFIDTYETEHTTNLNRPIGVKNVPVTIPMTSDLSDRIDCVIDVSEKAFRALETAELTVLEESKEVKEYTKSLIEFIENNLEIIDEMINEYSIGWDIERLLSMDKNILRLAVAELLFVKDVPVKVTFDEAVELTKKYSGDESSSFINGILGKIVEIKKIKK